MRLLIYVRTLFDLTRLTVTQSRKAYKFYCASAAVAAVAAVIAAVAVAAGVAACSGRNDRRLLSHGCITHPTRPGRPWCIDARKAIFSNAPSFICMNERAQRMISLHPARNHSSQGRENDTTTRSNPLPTTCPYSLLDASLLTLMPH